MTKALFVDNLAEETEATMIVDDESDCDDDDKQSSNIRGQQSQSFQSKVSTRLKKLKCDSIKRGI